MLNLPSFKCQHPRTVTVTVSAYHYLVGSRIFPSVFFNLSIGHIKLTDFGLSKVDIDRDLQIKDFCSKTPLRLDVKQKTSIAGLRTPGQILSLTSHLSFASNSKSSSDFTQQESVNSVSTMSDGNITHQHSPKKLNISLGVSPEKQRVRQLSNASSNRYTSFVYHQLFV